MLVRNFYRNRNWFIENPKKLEVILNSKYGFATKTQKLKEL
jgi:hypothetical protein